MEFLETLKNRSDLHGIIQVSKNPDADPQAAADDDVGKLFLCAL